MKKSKQDKKPPEVEALIEAMQDFDYKDPALSIAKVIKKMEARGYETNGIEELIEPGIKGIVVKLKKGEYEDDEYYQGDYQGHAVECETCAKKDKCIEFNEMLQKEEIKKMYESGDILLENLSKTFKNALSNNYASMIRAGLDPELIFDLGIKELIIDSMPVNNQADQCRKDLAINDMKKLKLKIERSAIEKRLESYIAYREAKEGPIFRDDIEEEGN